MSAVLSSSIVDQLSGWQAGFLAVLPLVKTHAQIRFRRMPAERREDAVQEAIASACESFQRLAAQGKLDVISPTSLATYAVRRVAAGRHVGGSQDAAKDVISPTAQRRHGFTTESVDRYDAGEGSWKELAIEGRRTSIPDLVSFRIDFTRWLRSFVRRDRRIIGALVRGDSTSLIAGRFCISRGRVSQLRRQFERNWRVFQNQALVDLPASDSMTKPRRGR